MTFLSQKSALPLVSASPRDLTLSRRQAFAAALVAFEYLSPVRVGAEEVALDAAEEEQRQLVRHVARFARTRARPASVETVLYKGQPMRQLIATVDLGARTRVAAYPVEVVSDYDSHGEEYALGIWREFVQRDRDGVLRRYQREF
jgi:hypothetical protein